MSENMSARVRQFILDEFLPGEDPSELTDTTPLISGGILDSIGTLKMVMFIEERFGITLQAHETDREYLDTVQSIVNLIQSKSS